MFQIKQQMTAGEIYEKDKEYYDNLAKNYISSNLKNKNDTCYIPFAMKTNYSRCMIKKINDDKYIIFNGLVQDINEGKYEGTVLLNAKEVNKKDLIEICGFEYSLNPFFRKEV